MARETKDQKLARWAAEEEARLAKVEEYKKTIPAKLVKLDSGFS